MLIDTGPLVAVLAERDMHHSVCVETLKTLRPPLVTSWAVLTEVTYLLRKHPESIQALFRLLNESTLLIPPIDASMSPWLAHFFTQYHDQDPQLADATLVYLPEQLQIQQIFTLDRRHFSIFRFGNGHSFSLLPAQL